MAVEISRKGWMQAFNDKRMPNMALTRLFQMRPGNVYKGTKVSIDIVRNGEKVAVVVTKRTGPNMNDITTWTSKEFEPPTYNEGFAINATDVLNRMVGIDPYSAADVEYSAQLIAMMIDGMSTVDHKIVRGVELQAAQILQTGKLDLLDENGATAYELDFKPKAAHFPTVGSPWSGAGDKIADLEALAKVIRTNGKVNPDTLIFGAKALNYFLDDAAVQKRLDVKSYNLGEINPVLSETGMTYYGMVQIGTYKFQIWAYAETYEPASGGAAVDYIDEDNVVMLSTRTRLDMTSAVVPLLVSPDPRVAGLLPGRLTSREAGYDVTPNVYAANNGKSVIGELESRPLLVPTQIDGFGCLNTGS